MPKGRTKPLYSEEIAFADTETGRRLHEFLIEEDAIEKFLLNNDGRHNDSISGAFYWVDTDEGHEYWESLANKWGRLEQEREDALADEFFKIPTTIDEVLHGVPEPSNEHVVTDLGNEPSKADIRKGQPVTRGFLWYFPNAVKEVAACSLAGNTQHHPDKPLHWDMDKSTDEQDALVRHLIDHNTKPIDDDGVLHLAKVAWRSMAMLERYLTQKQKL